MHIMASDGSQSQRGNSYLIWQSNAIMQVYETINNTLTWRKDFSSLPAQFGETHVYEVLYDAGRLDIWRNGKYVGNWTDTTPLTSGSFISLRTNAAHVSFDDVMMQGDPAITTTFSDGLGREIQSQTWNGAYDIISKTTYNSIGLVEKQYKPQEISNATHAYYSSLTGLYELFEYFDDPLARLKKQTHMGGASAIRYSYGSELFNGLTYRFEQVRGEINDSSRTYFDKFGNTVGGRAAIGTAKETKWVNDYDILGQVTTIKPPNFWNPPGNTSPGHWDSQNTYNTLGQLTQSITPDDSTTKFVYDKNGNLRYIQNMAQAPTGDFTAYHYDKHNRVTWVGEEKNIDWNSTPPSITDTTYGKDAGEWKVRHFYDFNYAGVPNYGQGKLTRTWVNDDGDVEKEHETLYIYDKFGNLTEKRITIDGGNPVTQKTIKHVYDLLGRETQVIYPSNNTVARQYDTLGRLKKIYTIP
jgi:YD repeat-containing protein